ncbi:MAG: MAPEG family protein [Rubrivivax sp.]|nr:MAPEG family protein [Rubrivivax sp.]
MALALSGLLLVIQLLVADLTAIRHRHKAGYPIPADSSKFIFRAARAHANTNETIAAFALLALSAMLLSASPAWVNALSIAWLVCRVAHMGFYYANVKLGRSVAFGLSLLALLGLFASATASLV